MKKASVLRHALGPVFAFSLLLTSPGCRTPTLSNPDRLSECECVLVDRILTKLLPVVTQRRKAQTMAWLTFDELYAPLNREERAWVKSLEKIQPMDMGIQTPFCGHATGEESLVVLAGQRIKAKPREDEPDSTKEMVSQYLPAPVHASYQRMMDAMEQDIGKRLLVESGYRSSAHQMFLVIFFLQKFNYGLRTAMKRVAMPGYSEHGAPKRQALDFITVEGVNGSGDPAVFEALPEFQWLQKNAARFGFELSYPKENPQGIDYEPWHWRYVGEGNI